MSAQQKKTNGWFFNKNIIDEINAVPEEVIIQEEEEKKPHLLEKQNTVKRDEITELKRLLSETEKDFNQYKKDSILEKQRLINENEKYKQSLLRTGEEKVQNRRYIQDLEAETHRIRKELEHLSEVKDNDQFKEKLIRAQEENENLKSAINRSQIVELELKEVKERYHKLILQQKEEKNQEYDKVQRLEQQIEKLRKELSENEELVVQLDQLINEKEEEIQQFINDTQDSAVKDQTISELQDQLLILQKENDQLKQETSHSQQEIGEVLVSARKQANRMIEKAKFDANKIVEHSESEIQTIYEQAKEISFEVAESRQAVLGIYEELKHRVDQLTKKTSLEKEKGSDH